MTLPLKIKQTKKTRTHWTWPRVLTWPKALSVLCAVYKYVIRYSTCNCQNCVIETSSIHTAVLITSWFSSNFTCYTSGVFGFITLQKKNPVTNKEKMLKTGAEKLLRKNPAISLLRSATSTHTNSTKLCQNKAGESNFIIFVFSHEIFEINVISVSELVTCCCLRKIWQMSDFILWVVTCHTSLTFKVNTFLQHLSRIWIYKNIIQFTVQLICFFFWYHRNLFFR